MYVLICVDAAVSIPVRPDWLFSRPSLTMDFITDATQPPDQVISFYLCVLTVITGRVFNLGLLCVIYTFSAQIFPLSFAPLYLRILWRYTNAVIIIIIITAFIVLQS